MNRMRWICGWVYQDKQFKCDNRVEANWGHHIWHFWDTVSTTYWLMDKVVSGFLCARKCSPTQRGKEHFFSGNDSGNEENSNTFGFSNSKHIIANYIWTCNKPGVGLITLLLSCSSCHIASQIYRRALLQLFVTINDSNPFLIPNLHSWLWANHPPPSQPFISDTVSSLQVTR